jgi:hypothetical protein
VANILLVLPRAVPALLKMLSGVEAFRIAQSGEDRRKVKSGEILETCAYADDSTRRSGSTRACCGWR